MNLLRPLLLLVTLSLLALRAEGQWIKVGAAKRKTAKDGSLVNRALGLYDMTGKVISRGNNVLLEDDTPHGHAKVVLLYYKPAMLKSASGVAMTVSGLSHPYARGYSPSGVFFLESLALVPMPAKVVVSGTDYWCLALRPTETWDFASKPTVTFCFPTRTERNAWQAEINKHTARPPREYSASDPATYFPSAWVESQPHPDTVTVQLQESFVIPRAMEKDLSGVKIPDLPFDSPRHLPGVKQAALGPELAGPSQEKLRKLSDSIFKLSAEENDVGGSKAHHAKDDSLSEMAKMIRDMYADMDADKVSESDLLGGIKKAKYTKGDLAYELGPEFCRDSMNKDFYTTEECYDWDKHFKKVPVADPSSLYRGDVAGEKLALRERLLASYHVITLKAGTTMYTVSKTKYGVKKGSHEPTVSGQGYKWLSIHEPHDWARNPDHVTLKYELLQDVDMLFVPDINSEALSGNGFSRMAADAKIGSYASCSECETVLDHTAFHGKLKLVAFAWPYNKEQHPTNRYSPIGPWHTVASEADLVSADIPLK